MFGNQTVPKVKATVTSSFRVFRGAVKKASEQQMFKYLIDYGYYSEMTF